MTEFPWDIKKGSDGKTQNAASSSELPAFLTGKGAPGEASPSSAPSIPDILANAFSGASMEEIKIEMPSFGNKNEGQPAPFAPPNFQNADDLSALFNKASASANPVSSEASKPSSGPRFPPVLEPPFLRTPISDIPQKNLDTVPLKDVTGKGPLPFSDVKLPSADKAGPKALQKTSKRSPPPLFKLKIPEDDSPETKAAEPYGMNSAGSPVSPFTSDIPPLFEKSEKAPHPPAPFAGTLSGDPISPFSSSLPEYVSPSPDPFKDMNPKPAGSTHSHIADSNSTFMQAGQSPFTGPMHSQAGSSAGHMPFSGNPFPGPGMSLGEPFNPVSKPFTSSSGNAQSQVDPFAGQMPFSSNPFSGPVPQSPNPFEPQSPAGVPFQGTQATFDPFAGAIKTHGNNSPGQAAGYTSPSLQGPSSLLTKMDALKKNLDGAGTTLRSLFKSMVAGKSLLERMEEIKDEPVSSSKPELRSPFTPEDVPADPFTGVPAASTVNAIPGFPGASGSPFELKTTGVPHSIQQHGGDPFAESIRKVTPIEEPLMELKEEHRIDIFSEEEERGAYVPDPDNEILKTIPVGKDNTGIPLNRACPVKEDQDSPVPEKILKSAAYEKIEGLASELGDVKAEMRTMMSRFADIDGNVLGLSANMEGLGSAVAELKEGERRSADIETRLCSVDEKLSSLENGLGSVCADNSDIRANLARMEESISELVNSYTALLVQMHESSQETESRFSQLEDAIIKLSPMEDRLRTLEKSNGESQSMSMELAKSISSLMDGLGATSADLREFKEAADLNHSKLRENLSLMTEYVDSELRKVGARSYKGYGQNVHLSSITKNSTNMKLCMEWLEFLMGLVGRNNLPDILSYYEELGWITEQVRSELMHYAEGIDFYMEKPDWKLTPDDHVKSIWFIESLAGLKVDKNRLSVIDRDIEKVKKGTEIYGI